MQAPRLRFLEFDEALRPADGHVVLHLVAGPISIGYKEPAGIAFQTAVLRQAGLIDDGPAPSSSDASSTTEEVDTNNNNTANPESDQPPAGVDWKGSKKKKKGDKKKGQDLYALLGLKNERWTANAKQLKDAYRKVCLEAHPDKKLVGVTDEEEKHRIEEYFKAVQDAYTTLSDPAKRREYDSVDEFDDSLPSECATQDFFKVFGPAFRRNARWSVDSRVPDIGDENSSYEEADKFYNFWFAFKSWREFPHPDEEDIEGAESREHRRWIERMNSKMREKGKKDDQKRLREFVENAYRIDPRIVKKKEEDRLQRDRKKQEKEDARRQAAEEEERKKADEAATKAAAEEAEKKAREEAKKARELQKKLTKKERQRLRTINEGDGTDRLLDDDDVEKLTSKLDMELLQALCDSLCTFGISREQQREIALEKVLSLSSKDELEARAKAQKRKEMQKALADAAKLEQQKKLESIREWGDEELRMLDKALSKFPQGTPKRWEQVTAYVRTRTMDEVLLIVKEQQGMSAARMKQSEDYKLGQKKRAEVKSQADLRMNAFTDVEVNLVGDAAQFLDPTLPPKDQGPAAAAAGPDPQPTTPAQEQEPAQAPETPPPTAAPAPAAVAAAAAAEAAKGGAKVSADSGSGVWNEEQEQALVKAMKQFGKELADRWERVAEVVPGKTKSQCFKRFKELRDMYRNKKAGPGGAAPDDE